MKTCSGDFESAALHNNRCLGDECNARSWIRNIQNYTLFTVSIESTAFCYSVSSVERRGLLLIFILEIHNVAVPYDTGS